MRALNYNHLHYFWVVAREGSVVRAADVLHLTPQTISGQIHLLEESVGTKLFRKTGRRLELTPAGELAYRYADDMFSLGTELREVLATGAEAERLRFTVGAADVLPKLIAQRLLIPAMRLPQPMRIICKENNLDNLLAELATHRIDLVLADRPIGSATGVKAFSHLLGESGVSFFAAPSVATDLDDAFPANLNGAPMLAPSRETYPRRLLDDWLDRQELKPEIVGEFDDTALMTAFGQAGLGIFPAATAIEDAIRDQYGVQVVGRTDAVKERYYAISAERKLEHPAVVAVSRAASRLLAM